MGWGGLFEQMTISELIYGRVVQSFVIVVGLLWFDFGGVYIIYVLRLVYFSLIGDYLVLKVQCRLVYWRRAMIWVSWYCDICK